MFIQLLPSRKFQVSRDRELWEVVPRDYQHYPMGLVLPPPALLHPPHYCFRKWRRLVPCPNAMASTTSMLLGWTRCGSINIVFQAIEHLHSVSTYGQSILYLKESWSSSNQFFCQGSLTDPQMEINLSELGRIYISQKCFCWWPVERS